MRKRLTAEGVKREAAPLTGQVEIFDDVVSAMALRVTANGARNLVVRARIKGQTNPIRVTIRTIREGDEIDLAEARKAARDVLIKCQNGQDPRKEEEPDVTDKPAAIKLAEAWANDRDGHMEARESSAATVLAYEGHIEGLLQDWLAKPLRKLSDATGRKLVRERHRKIANENGPYRANSCMRTLRAGAP
jgi:hypothetical protein